MGNKMINEEKRLKVKELIEKLQVAMNESEKIDICRECRYYINAGNMFPCTNCTIPAPETI